LRRISRFAAALLVLACALFVASTATADAAKKGKGKVVVTNSQKKIVKKKAIPVTVKKLERGSVKLKAKSSTFDEPKFKKLAKPTKVKTKGNRAKATVMLKLTGKARKRVKSCEAREIKVSGRGVKSKKVDLKRNTKSCKPKKVDLTRAENCNFIGYPDEICMLPFPDDFHTVKDESSATGKRINFKDAGMLQNSGGTPIAAADYNRNDGFSPGQTIVVKVPGLDTPEAMAATNPIPLSDLSRNDDEAKREPIVVINAKTRERHPIWVELDSNASTPERTALLIHPARNWDSGTRYVVAMRKLKDAAGNRLDAPEGFRYLRDDLPSKQKPIKSQRKRFKKVFKALRKANIKRANLNLAWDFTVSSDENIAERMLHIRNDAFALLGDTDLDDQVVQGASPQFTVESVDNTTPAEDPEMARRVQGTFEVPCYLTNPDPGPECAVGSRFELGPNGLPSRTDTWTANFNCAIPHAAVDDPGAAPGRPQVYGHGLLGSASQATSGDQQELSQAHNFIVCATDEIGFSSNDVPNIAANILPNMSNFPELTDRVQQGLLNELFLGRLLIHPDGFTSDAAFHVNDADVNSPPVIDTSRLYYNGNSQGGILGGALTAVAPDFTRSVLGVPAMNYSVLLNRSVDFDTYKLFLDPAYPDAVGQQLLLSQIQMLWDRSDPNGYAHRMTDNPLPDTPPHEVLLSVAFGDHQVTTWQADVEARTIGAEIHDPVVYDGRWPGIDIAWGIPRISQYPFTDSAIVYWDSGPTRPDPMNPGEVIGTDPPPLTNTPNRSGEDPHGDPRVAPEQMQMVSDFLQPDAQSHITDTCGGPCYAGGFTGP
jgi:hypothetical protein